MPTSTPRPERKAGVGQKNGHQGHLHWYQSTAPGCRHPNQVSALVSFCPGLEVPKERAWLKLPVAGWRKTGLSVMAPQRQRTSQKRFRKLKTQQEEGGGQRFQNSNCSLPRGWLDLGWWGEWKPDHKGPCKSRWEVCPFSRWKWEINERFGAGE